MPSPQRQRDHRSPMRHGVGSGGYPHGMYGGMPSHHHPYPGQHSMGMNTEYDNTSPRFGGGPPPPQGQFPGPQGFHPAAAMGQYGQYPFYGGYPGHHHPNGYYPPNAGHRPEHISRNPSEGNYPMGGPISGSGGVGHYPPSSPTRKSAHSSKQSSPADEKVSPNQLSSHRRSKDKTPTSIHSRRGEVDDDIKDTSSVDYNKSPEKTSSLENKFSPSHDASDSKSTGPVTGQSADEEDLTSGVNPMRSDFHFFAMEYKDDITEKIRAEQSSKNIDKEGTTEASPFVTFTELNERLIKLWENKPVREKALYMQKEESDRYRFMSEDEIASRHCATLTSRQGSAKKTSNAEKDESEEKNESNGKKNDIVAKDQDNVNSEYESPSKKSKISPDNGPEGEDEEKDEEKKEVNSCDELKAKAKAEAGNADVVQTEDDDMITKTASALEISKEGLNDVASDDNAKEAKDES